MDGRDSLWLKSPATNRSPAVPGMTSCVMAWRERELRATLARSASHIGRRL